jgi:LAO/AO transport system kinase
VKRGLLNGDRVALGKALSLIESNLSSDHALAQELLQDVLPSTGKSLRIGITGVPGVGKSTFIEVFGTHIINQGKKVAVLTVDPSSKLSKGSILGDKTRMPGLANNTSAFIRPTASGSSLGGVAIKTREAILLCEAAGYDVNIIETVGVGQSEIAIKQMVDFFLLLMLAGAGDELQGMKKGIVEMADAILITKCDGDNERKALEAKSEYQHALHLLSSQVQGWAPEVHVCSALENRGIAEAWVMIVQFENHVKKNGAFEKNRNRQQISWIHEQVNYLLKLTMYQSPLVKIRMNELEKKVLSMEITASDAAESILKTMLSELKKSN